MCKLLVAVLKPAEVGKGVHLESLSTVDEIWHVESHDVVACYHLPMSKSAGLSMSTGGWLNGKNRRWNEECLDGGRACMSQAASVRDTETLKGDQ